MFKIAVFVLFNILLINSVPVPPGMTEKEFDELMNTGDMGDVLLPEDELNEISNEISGRVGMVNTNLRWPNRIVPFVISTAFSATQQNLIRSAMNTVASQTCISFVQRTNQADFVSIVNGNGCSSFVGRIRGSQQLSLRIPGCLTTPIIIHELLHAIGLHHMHQYEGRYSHVTINWNNIQTGTERNFNRIARTTAHNFGTAYDYHSVMHYRATAFSRNGLPTITTRNAAMQNVIGRGSGMSTGDIRRARTIYGC